jgi:hypothetical protein
MIELHCDFCEKVICVGEVFHKLSLYKFTDAGYTHIGEDSSIEEGATVMCSKCFHKTDGSSDPNESKTVCCYVIGSLMNNGATNKELAEITHMLIKYNLITMEDYENAKK